MDATTIAKQFSGYYYGIFDTDRSQLSTLYRETSMMTWEGAEFLGTAKIVNKLTTLPFEKVQHRVTTVDAQPSGNGLLVFFTGILAVDGDDRPLQFSQTFQLQQNENGTGFWVSNDIFRLNYG
ncbi:Nuclear transport factor 2 [Leucoagaricus gongylophorus]